MARAWWVAAASCDARACGVLLGMHSTGSDAYRAVSHQIHAIFADYNPLIEPLSLDEAYLDVTQHLRGLGTASATATISVVAFSKRLVSRPCGDLLQQVPCRAGVRPA